MDLAYEISLNLRWPASRRRVGGNLGNNNTSLPNRRLAWFASSRSSSFFHLHSLQACSHPRRHPSPRRSVVRSIDRSLARSLSREPPVVAFVVRRSPLHYRSAFLLCYSTKSARCSPPTRATEAVHLHLKAPAVPPPHCLLALCNVHPRPVRPPIRHPSPVGPLGRTLLLFNLTTNLSPNQRPPFCAFDLA